MSEKIKVEIEFDVHETYRGMTIFVTNENFDATIGGLCLTNSGRLRPYLFQWQSLENLKPKIDEFIGDGYELIKPKDADRGNEFYSVQDQIWILWNGYPNLHKIWRRKVAIEENVFDRIQSGQPIDAQRSTYDVLGDAIKKLEEVRAKIAASSEVDA